MVELLKIFQNQIDTIKLTIDNLIKTTIASETEILELKNPPEIPQTNEEKVINTSNTNGFDELLKTNDILTDLPPKPESLKSKDEGDFIGLPKFDDKDKLKPVPKPINTRKVKKRDLIAEKKALEGKLKSVRNLLEFIEKKHDSGQMDEKSYEKRATQLKNDLITTQNKIDKIDKKSK